MNMSKAPEINERTQTNHSHSPSIIINTDIPTETENDYEEYVPVLFTKNAHNNNEANLSSMHPQYSNTTLQNNNLTRLQQQPQNAQIATRGGIKHNISTTIKATTTSSTTIQPPPPSYSNTLPISTTIHSPSQHNPSLSEGERIPSMPNFDLINLSSSSCQEPQTKSPRLSGRSKNHQPINHYTNPTTTYSQQHTQDSSYNQPHSFTTLPTQIIPPTMKSEPFYTTTTNTSSNTHNNNINTTADMVISSSSLDKPSPSPPDRRQKRLERNRESARLSRRRRKQYLEVLEERVNILSNEMDKGRCDHVLCAIQTYQTMRSELLKKYFGLNDNDDDQEEEEEGVSSHAIIHQNMKQHSSSIMDDDLQLRQNLCRSSSELMVGITFGREYLKSMVVAPSSKFLLWLTLQNESFFRGGRGANERLSAARIGERMLHCGTDHAAPINGMWPLFCNEIGLSYDQEDKTRSIQRLLLMNPQSWLARHIAYSRRVVLHSLHDAILGASELTKQRDRKVMDILTPEQRLRYLAWLESKKRKANYESKMNSLVSMLTEGLYSKVVLNDKSNNLHQMEIKEDNHVAVNLYLTNHNLRDVCTNSFPSTNTSLIPNHALKKLSRRPSFEKLASTNEDEKGSSSLDKSHRNKSSGSLKRSSSEMSCDSSSLLSSNVLVKSSSGSSLQITPNVTPEAAYATCSQFLSEILDPIRSVIPPIIPHVSSSSDQTSHNFIIPNPSHYQTLSTFVSNTRYPEANTDSIVPKSEDHYPSPTPYPTLVGSSVSLSHANYLSSPDTNNQQYHQFKYPTFDNRNSNHVASIQPIAHTNYENQYSNHQHPQAPQFNTLTTSKSAPALSKYYVPSPLIFSDEEEASWNIPPLNLEIRATNYVPEQVVSTNINSDVGTGDFSMNDTADDLVQEALFDLDEGDEGWDIGVGFDMELDDF